MNKQMLAHLSAQRSCARNMKKQFHTIYLMLFLGLFLAGCHQKDRTPVEDSSIVRLTNASSESTQEMFAAYDELFARHWLEERMEDAQVTVTHGGSGIQAGSVIENGGADVVTFSDAYDITRLEDEGLIKSGWEDGFDHGSAPYSSIVVFLVRKGNEHEISDWDDLTQEGLDVITPDPETSGSGRWNFLAAWAYAQEDLRYDSEKDIKKFLTQLYGRVLVMDTGSRGAVSTFVERGQGDVLITWESEARLSIEEYPEDYEIVVPTVSVEAPASVAVVDSAAEKNGTDELAREYLEYMYSEEAQRLIGENYYRPADEKVLEEFSDQFVQVTDLRTIEDFGGWKQAYEDFFQEGALFGEVAAALVS